MTRQCVRYNQDLQTLTVKRIVRGSERRPVLYGEDPNYGVIADVPEKDFRVEVGDVIKYEPAGVNFGFMVTTPSQPKFSDRLRQAIQVGMVVIDETKKEATILAPPHVESMSDDDWLDVIAAASEMQRELQSLGYLNATQLMESRPPGEFSTFCDRCKQYSDTCLLVPYRRPPLLTPPEMEPVIGPDYIDERVVIDPEDLRMKHAAMCRVCRELKQQFKSDTTN